MQGGKFDKATIGDKIGIKHGSGLTINLDGFADAQRSGVPVDGMQRGSYSNAAFCVSYHRACG